MNHATFDLIEYRIFSSSLITRVYRSQVLAGSLRRTPRTAVIPLTSLSAWGHADGDWLIEGSDTGGNPSERQTGSYADSDPLKQSNSRYMTILDRRV
jgi:hypothetical protein